MQQTEFREIQAEDDEISLVDAIRFFGHNRKFLTLTTAGLSAIAITLSLLTPEQYQKQLALSIKPIPLQLSQPILGLDANQINTRAIELLKERPKNQINPKRTADADKISAKPKYDPATQRLDVTLRSPDPSFLKDAAPKVISRLKSEFQDILSETLQTSITSTELQIQRNQVALAQLEQQIAKLNPSNLANPQGMRTVARLEALETQRANYTTTIATLKFDKEYLKQAQKNPAQFAAKVISVQILTESEVRQTRSLLQIAVIAAIASFMIAVIAAIIRNQVARLRDELSQQKLKPSKDV